MTLSSPIKTVVLSSLLCGGVALFLAGFIKRRKLLRKLKDAPPGDLGFWGLGQFLEFAKGPRPFDMARMEKFGLNYRTHILFAPVLRLGTVEDRQRVFRSEAKGEAIQALPTHWVKQLGENSSLVISGERHTFLRKFFLTAFTPEVMKQYVGTVDACVCEYLEAMNDGKVHNSAEELQDLAMDIFLRTIFGSNVAPGDVRKLSDLFNTWTAGFGTFFPFDIPFTTYGKATRARKALIAWIDRMVRDCPGTGKDLMTRFVTYRDESGESLTPEEIFDNLLLLMFAGHDTTSASFSTMITILFDPKNAHVLTKLRGEVRSIEPQDDNALRNCEYLCGVIDEAWRMVPPVGSSYRMPTQDIQLSDGHVAPQGVKIGTYTTAGHYSQEAWGNPFEFDPERFARIRNEKPEIVRSYYYPFGGGSRSCVGEVLARLELRTFVFRLARDWDIKILDVAARPFPIARISCTFTLSRWNQAKA